MHTGSNFYNLLCQVEILCCTDSCKSLVCLFVCLFLSVPAAAPVVTSTSYRRLREDGRHDVEIFWRVCLFGLDCMMPALLRDAGYVYSGPSILKTTHSARKYGLKLKVVVKWRNICIGYRKLVSLLLK